MKKISVCIGCYNEEKNIPVTYETLTKVFEEIPQYDYEIIFSDNCSKDASRDVIREIAAKDAHVKAIFNMGNYGAARSGRNCCNSATGDALIMMPCDMQEPPEMIPTFVQEWEKGNLIVWGQRVGSKESKIKYNLRKLYYKIIKYFSEVDQIANTNGFGIMDMSVYRQISNTKEEDMPLRYLVAELRYSVKLIPYVQNSRKSGKSSYSLSSSLDFSIRSLVYTSKKPIRLATVVGVLSSGLFTLGLLVTLITSIFSYVPVWIPIVLSIFLCSSVLLFFIGMVGEYLLRVLNRVTLRPLVIEKERINF